MDELRLFPVTGVGEIPPDADLSAEIIDGIESAGETLRDSDVVVVTSKVVSKAERCAVQLSEVTPSRFATSWAQRWGKDPRVVEVVLAQSRRIVRQVGPVLIAETWHGFVCANAGVDQSSAGAPGQVLTLPVDPDASARRLRDGFAAVGASVAVIITDTFGRPWRTGQTDIAIGVAGIEPMRSYIGEVDPHGHEFMVQQLCVVDELAAAAELVKGNTSRVPAVVVRGYRYEASHDASIASVLRDSAEDLFR